MAGDHSGNAQTITMEQMLQAMTEIFNRIQPPQQPTAPQWKASEIGYFWPDLSGDSDIVDKDDKPYYRAVYAFTNRVHVFGQIRNKATICRNLDTCFRGEALSWWTNELDHTTRLGLQQDDDIEPYCQKLEARFKPTSSEALRKLQMTWYTLLDARNKKPITAYVSEIVTAAKASNQGNTEFSQVLLAWTNLDLELRETIDEPQEGTTIGDPTAETDELVRQIRQLLHAKQLPRSNPAYPDISSSVQPDAAISTGFP